MNDFKSKEERRQERERQLQIMRSVAVELDPHQPGATGSNCGVSVGSHSTGSASTGAGSGSGSGGTSGSRRGVRRNRAADGQQRLRRSRSADVANKIMRDAGMPVSSAGSGSDASTPSRSARRVAKGDSASAAMLAPRRRSADLTQAIEKSVNMSSTGSANRSSIGFALDALEKDVSERSAAETAASGGKERPPRSAVDNARKFLWDDDLPDVNLDPMSAPTDIGGRAERGVRSSSASSWRRARDDANYADQTDFGAGAKSRLNYGGGQEGRTAPTGVGAHYVGRAAPGLGYGYGGATETKSRRSLFDAGSMGKSIRGIFGGFKQSSGKGLVEVDFNANLAPRRVSGDAADVASSMFYDAPAAHHIANRAANHRDPYGPDPISVRLRDSFDTMLDSMSDCIDSIYYASSGCMDYTSRHIWKVLFLLAAVMLIIGASVTFTSRKADGGASSSYIQRGEPLVGAVGSIGNKARYNALKDVIVKGGVSSSSDFESKNSPQSRALYWIAETDELQIALDDPYMAQRYALATFYCYSVDAETAAEEDTEADDSRDEDGDRNIRRRLQDTTLNDSAVGWKSTSRWMTKRGHCSWTGIECIHRPGSFEMDTIYDGTNSIIVLNMTENRVKGIIPKEIGAALKDLKILDLGQNMLTGTIPSTLGDATDLSTLYLGDNALTGTIPSSLGKLTKCTHLYVDRNNLQGPLPNELSNLSEITMLGLHQNTLTGAIPDLSAMKKLRALYLDSNELSGELPTSIGELSALIDLRLGSNEITGTIPTELGNLESLRDLHIQRNRLSGSLPLSFAGMKNLREFHAYSNKITGKIPVQIGFLGFFSQLKILYLDGNELTGTIPPSVANMKDLVDLYLGNNNLEGPIPTTIYRLSSLKNLRLNDNELTGTIPVEFDKLSQLEYLYLQNCRLEGAIPNELGVLNKLFRLRLYGNALSGTMPRGVCHLRGLHLEELQVDCEGVSPAIECTCCTTCF